MHLWPVPEGAAVDSKALLVGELADSGGFADALATAIRAFQDTWDALPCLILQLDVGPMTANDKVTHPAVEPPLFRLNRASEHEHSQR
ncbi:hypothetical protein [Streptomyces phaeoluteigriseus]